MTRRPTNGSRGVRTTALGAGGVLAAVVSYAAFMGVIGGLIGFQGDLDEPLTVVYRRQPVEFVSGWSYFIPVVAVLSIGVVAMFWCIALMIRPPRART